MATHITALVVKTSNDVGERKANGSKRNYKELTR